jgi:purine-binding chemotaxis protein CheW
MAQYCTFQVADLHLGIEVERVQEVLRPQQMTAVPLASEVVRGLINLRGEIVTAVDLRRRLAIAAPSRDTEQMNVVVRARSGGPVSFLVDEIGDVLDVPHECFEEPPPNLRHPVRALVRSVCKLDDQLLLILDPFEALNITHANRRSEA